MAKKILESGLYAVHCTECGDEIENKFFPLDNLLRQYYNGQDNSSVKRDAIIDTLGIGALYGQAVLPEVPALLRKTGYREYELQLPDLNGIRPELGFFCCSDDDLVKQPLKAVNLNIASIVAQFCLMSGFYAIYRMLRLQKEILDQADLDDNLAELQSDLNNYCDKFASLSCVNLGKMSTMENRRKEICRVLSYILDFARVEADMPDERHFATETLYAGWRYETLNGRYMPLSLVVMGGSHSYDCTKCCCDKCHRPIPYEMGAYEQRIIGLLGTQATGKTTYLVALADAIERGEVTTLEVSGETRSASVLIEHTMANDFQWNRVNQEAVRGDSEAGPLSGSKAGPLWLYRNGFPPEKTNVKEMEAPALTFLLSRNEGSGEPVMYTLADIPGEAFDDVVAQKLDAKLVQKVTKLLRSCSAYILVVSSRQMNDYGIDEEDDLVRDPNRILTCFKDYLPQEPLPTAVAMTASDEINNGDLRRPLHIAYDIRKCSPLIWSDRKKTLVYNAEAMAGAVRAVKNYFNNNDIFKVFMTNLSGILSQGSSAKPLKLAAFAVSSGTQFAKVSYQGSSDEYRSPAAQAERYSQMRQGRFGVAAPLLWLLACEGMLEVGRGDNDFNQYPPQIQDLIQAQLEKSL